MKAHRPIKQSKTQAKPPTLVFVGEPAKVSANMAKAIAGKGRCNKAVSLFIL
jgi:hypothetical protein